MAVNPAWEWARAAIAAKDAEAAAALGQATTDVQALELPGLLTRSCSATSSARSTTRSPPTPTR